MIQNVRVLDTAGWNFRLEIASLNLNGPVLDVSVYLYPFPRGETADLGARCQRFAVTVVSQPSPSRGEDSRRQVTTPL